MKWSTEIPISKGPGPIDYQSRVLLLGSCFAAQMGERMAYFQFRQWTNPFGVVFHPDPIWQLVERTLDYRPFSENDLFEHQGLWRTLQAHSSVAAPEKAASLDRLARAQQALNDGLHKASHLIITLGTARGYRHLQSGMLAANCHKLPGAQFERELTGVAEVADTLRKMLGRIREENPGVCCILTVSPIRHIRDGLVASQQSKAHLLAAVHQVVGEGLARYFPAYEILMDELRDYRFYAEDLVHPSDVAVDHVWDRFAGTWVAPEAVETMETVSTVQKGLNHVPAHPDSREHLHFLEDLRARIATLQSRYPHMEFTEPGQVQ